MTTRAELVEAVAALIEPHIIADNAESLSASILALIAERLREPNEEIDRAMADEFVSRSDEPLWRSIWLSALAASPLYPSKEG